MYSSEPSNVDICTNTVDQIQLTLMWLIWKDYSTSYSNTKYKKYKVSSQFGKFPNTIKVERAIKTFVIIWFVLSSCVREVLLLNVYPVTHELCQRTDCKEWYKVYSK